MLGPPCVFFPWIAWHHLPSHTRLPFLASCRHAHLESIGDGPGVAWFVDPPSRAVERERGNTLAPCRLGFMERSINETQ